MLDELHVGLARERCLHSGDGLQGPLLARPSSVTALATWGNDMDRALKAWSLVIASVLAGCGSSYEALDSEPGSQRLDTAMNEPAMNHPPRGAGGPPIEPPAASGEGTAGEGAYEPP